MKKTSYKVQQIIIFLTVRKMASQMQWPHGVPSKTTSPTSCYPIIAATKWRPLLSSASTNRPLQAQIILIKMKTRSSFHAHRTNAWPRGLRLLTLVQLILISKSKKLLWKQRFHPPTKELEK